MSIHNIPFPYKKKIALNYSKSVAMGFSKGLKNEFETAVVNDASVFEPLKVYCILQPKSTEVYIRRYQGAKFAHCDDTNVIYHSFSHDAISKVLSVAWSFGAQMVLFLLLRHFSGSSGVKEYVVSFESSSLIHYSDLFVFIVDSMMG